MGIYVVLHTHRFDSPNVWLRDELTTVEYEQENSDFEAGRGDEFIEIVGPLEIEPVE